MGRKTIKSMLDAKKALLLSIDIGEINYKFEADMFDLDSRSIPNLSDQIAKIPGYVAFVIEAHGQAEKELAKAQVSFEIWWAKQMNKLDESDSKKAEEKQKKIIMANQSACSEVIKRSEEIAELKKLVRVLDAYRKGIDAKLQLAQTLSANIREERESYRRKYDKDGKREGRGKLGRD
jgi:hypothetical protein